MISIDTIKAARDGDFEAMSALINGMEPQVGILSRRTADRIGDVGSLDEFRQVANIALWEALNNFSGDDADGFCAYAYRMMEIAVRHAADDMRGHSATRHQMAAFAKAMEKADGDIDLATNLAQLHTYSSNVGRLSRDAAWAARLAWLGRSSLDVPAVADRAPAVTQVETDIPAPEVNPNKIKAAFRALEPHIIVTGDVRELWEACRMFSRGVVSETALDILSESVRLPKERRTRLFVQGAFGILAAAVRSADHSATPADEYDDKTDENPAARASVARTQTVRAILDAMSEKQRLVLEHTYGIRGRTVYGSDDNEALSIETGLTPYQINQGRTKGKESFGKRWIKAMSRGEDDRKALEAAMKSTKRS